MPLACLRIDGGFRAGDGRAQRGPARSDLHVRPVLRQPKAPGIGRCRTRAKQRKNRHGDRGTKPGEIHDTYFVSPGRTSKPKSLPYRRLARSKKARDSSGGRRGIEAELIKPAATPPQAPPAWADRLPSPSTSAHVAAKQLSVADMEYFIAALRGALRIVFGPGQFAAVDQRSAMAEHRVAR